MEQPSYHLLARENGRARAIGELVLAIVIWFGGMGILSEIVMRAAGARTLVELDGPTSLLLLCGSIALAIPATWCAAWAVRRDPRQLLGVAGRLRWKRLAKLAVIALALRLVEIAALIGIALVAGQTEAAADTDWPGLPRFALLAAMLAVLVPLQVAGEEMLFRGTLMQAVGAWVRTPWLAIAVSTLVFVLNHHGSNAAIVGVACTGLVLGWLTIRTGGLEAALALHWAGNFVGLTLMTASGELSPTSINIGVPWLSTLLDIPMLVAFSAIVLRVASPQRPLAGPDQLGEHAPERRLGVEHAEHRGRAEPLTP